MYAKQSWHASPVLRGLTNDKTLDWSGYTDSFRPDWKEPEEVNHHGLHDEPTIKEWVEKTVDRVIGLLASTNSDMSSTVAALKAARSCSVAEMGVGKGMIIFRLMPFCERVLAGDMSKEALAYVEKTATELSLLTNGDGKNACSLQITSSGDAIKGLADIYANHHPVQCVVCNGVALYFESVPYTLDFLATAGGKVTPGVYEKKICDCCGVESKKVSGPAGTVFLGDVRTAEQAKYFDVQKMVRVAANKADWQAQKDTEQAIAAGISMEETWEDTVDGPLVPLWTKDMPEEVEAVRKQLVTEKYFRNKYLKWSDRRDLIGADKDRVFDFRGFYRNAMRDTSMGGLGNVGVIETRLKPGKIRSEFSNYRYDVILHRFPDGYLESVDGRVEKLPGIVTKAFHEGLDIELIQKMVKVGSLIQKMIAIWRRGQV